MTSLFFHLRAVQALLTTLTFFREMDVVTSIQHPFHEKRFLCTLDFVNDIIQRIIFIQSGAKRLIRSSYCTFLSIFLVILFSTTINIFEKTISIKIYHLNVSHPWHKNSTVKKKKKKVLHKILRIAKGHITLDYSENLFL